MVVPWCLVKTAGWVTVSFHELGNEKAGPFLFLSLILSDSVISAIQNTLNLMCLWILESGTLKTALVWRYRFGIPQHTGSS